MGGLLRPNGDSLRVVSLYLRRRSHVRIVLGRPDIRIFLGFRCEVVAGSLATLADLVERGSGANIPRQFFAKKK
jgi:hypothetical protein